MATGKLAGDVVEPTSLCHAPSEVGDDAQREWVAADAGEVFPEQIDSSSEVAVAAVWTTSMDGAPS